MASPSPCCHPDPDQRRWACSLLSKLHRNVHMCPFIPSPSTFVDAQGTAAVVVALGDSLLVLVAYPVTAVVLVWAGTNTTT